MVKAHEEASEAKFTIDSLKEKSTFTLRLDRDAKRVH